MSQTAHCPRCMYDLTGTAPAQVVPDDVGTCPECGLQFRWDHIFHPLMYAPSWFIETTLGPVEPAAIKTALQTFRPWKFWDRIEMAFARRVMQAWIVALLAILMVYLAYVIVHGILAILGPATRVPVFSTVPIIGRLFTPATASWSRLDPFWLHLLGPAWLTLGYASYVLMPLTMLAAKETLSTYRVRSGHILRIWLYSAGSFVLAVALPGLIPAVAWIVSVQILGASKSIVGTQFMDQYGFFVRVPLSFLALTSLWAWGLGKYARIPSPWFHAAVLACVAHLGGFGVTLLIHSALELF